MNRKNAILMSILILGVVLVVGTFTIVLKDKRQLEETLHEQRNTLSVTLETLQETEKQLHQTEATVKDLSIHVDEMKEEANVLSAKVSELTTANQKLVQEKQKIQKDYDTLKKNKAIAAEKAKQSSQTNKEIVASRSNTQTATKTFYVTATAYTASCKGCSGITATGINLRKNPSLKLIAVDPRVIPLGSKVWVEGYGHAIAGDTGGAIKGNKIDLHMASNSDARNWGRRKVQIKVLK